ncbi:hypothetical protein BH18ACI3_BH18ACI3_10840 [soil metagenome]
MACLMDTGFWFASIDESDTHHERVVKATKNIREQVIVPSPAITETAYLVRRNLGVERLAKFSEKLNSTKFQIESPTGNDYIRIAAVLRKYNDVNIDFVDACIVAMAATSQRFSRLTDGISEFSNRCIAIRSRFCRRHYEDHGTKTDVLD